MEHQEQVKSCCNFLDGPLSSTKPNLLLLLPVKYGSWFLWLWSAVSCGMGWWGFIHIFIRTTAAIISIKTKTKILNTHKCLQLDNTPNKSFKPPKYYANRTKNAYYFKTRLFRVSVTLGIFGHKLSLLSPATRPQCVEHPHFVFEDSKIQIACYF